MINYSMNLKITIDGAVQTLTQDSTISFNPRNDEFLLVVKYYE